MLRETEKNILSNVGNRTQDFRVGINAPTIRAILVDSIGRGEKEFLGGRGEKKFLGKVSFDGS